MEQGLPNATSDRDRDTGRLNGIGSSMFVVDGASERTGQKLKILLDTRADRTYVSSSIASDIGDLQQGRLILIDLPTGQSVNSNEHARILVRIGTYQLAT